MFLVLCNEESHTKLIITEGALKKKLQNFNFWVHYFFKFLLHCTTCTLNFPRKLKTVCETGQVCPDLSL